MRIGPDIWGPHGWKFLHFVALGYPNNPTEDAKKNYKDFFTLIPTILPCHICSNHFNENLKKHPITDTVLSNKINLLNWTIDMHNEVNISNNKDAIDYETALNLIINNYSSDKIDDHQISHNSNLNKENKRNKENKVTIKVKRQQNVKTRGLTKYILLFIILVVVLLYLYYCKKHMNNKI